MDKIDFDEQESDWKTSFKKSKFENIFNNNLEDYLLKLVSKVRKMEDLGTVISIINEEEIKKMEKFEFLISLLRRKALSLMKKMDLLKESLSKIDKLSALTSLFKIIYKYTEKWDKIEDIFQKLEAQYKHIVLIELLNSFPDDRKLYEHIFNFYINNINIYYKNIIELFELFNKKSDNENIKLFMEKISDKKNNRILSYENFFLEKESLNLNILHELYKNINLIENTFYYGEIQKVLEKVYNRIEKKKLEIKYLITLLSFPKDNVIKRLELLTILNKPIKPEDKYEELKAKKDKALNEIKELKEISQALKVFHNEYYQDEIKKIDELIEKFNDGEIKKFDYVSTLMLDLEEVKNKVETINKVKDNSIFRKIYLDSQGKNQDEKYESTFENLRKIFPEIKRKIKMDNQKIKGEFKTIIEILGLKEDLETQKDLKYMEDSSGSEEDIKSMIFFCENFKINETDNIRQNEEFDLEEFLREVYDNFSNPENKNS